MSKRKKDRNIPPCLGNEVCGVWPYIMALIIDLAMHIRLFLYVANPSPYTIFRLIISYIFFIYPFCYVADVLWSMRPSVTAILSGEAEINCRNYANTARSDIDKTTLLPVTISIPVYMEQNEVIFETIRQSMQAIKHFRNETGKKANLVISDDGLAQMLGGSCTQEAVETLISQYQINIANLSQLERLAARRILFYRDFEIGFVARPTSGRTGKFKKASNLNYTYRLAERLSEGEYFGMLTGAGGDFEGGYYEGDITISEIILLLDKDSGLSPGILAAVAPEFVGDEKLAYVQCATRAANISENYFTKAVGYNTNNLFHNIWPCKALQGYFVPLVGHNVFVKKSLLTVTGLWPEDRVSEDYAKAIDFYNHGYHGKYVQFKGLEFTEVVSRTFAEETSKQFRYNYGLLEMLFQGTIIPGQTRSCDTMFMIMYFFSCFNAAMLLPTALLECYFGNVNLIWAGFILCNIGFIILPCIRSLIMRKRLPSERRANLGHTTLLALTNLGHTHSILAGFFSYFSDRLRRRVKAFPTTNVDSIDYRFVDGIRLLWNFYKRNKGLLPVMIMCIERCIFIWLRLHVELPTLLTYTYIFLVSVLVPIIMTPQLYSAPIRFFNKSFSQSNIMVNEDSL
ncbi:glycosyltransferase family 2 protein [Ohessyouella blattaphilus]|uniref:Glycosyltransferase 2-like domain-containing protein n=2 Tax=Ohessyouella blattaphilus TaxID=2949333 RepID=A0ABT1EJC7_9FIRM|nr:glycosyltransferase family 2 protein [Ohessyouella blattaphilus]MCP1109872.1 hypothetical protein [Ohessyouella blattaphilus]MCR8563266.1 hypothetical protein [Ohessyouella blattaphilus]